MSGLDFDGFMVVENVLDKNEVLNLIGLIESEVSMEASRGGARNLLDIPTMRALAQGAPVRRIVDPILGSAAKVVRGTLFDKTRDANWKVPWHQDCTIAVVERIDVDGYGPWSTKAGVVHVQPPASVLESMVSVRIHLDACPEENGALRVVAGSHLMGKIPETQIADVVLAGRQEVCAVRVGGVLVMRPLVLHRSSPAAVPGHRRVLHFDFAVGGLDNGLRWAADGPELMLDAGSWESFGDVYDSFFAAVSAPKRHGRNFDALRDSIATGSINQVEVPYVLVIENLDLAAPDGYVAAQEFIGFLRELEAEGCPVSVVVRS